jgi:nicotinic acid mononucleotide adenylyltransferase
MKNIVLYGGSFNPPCVHHVQIVRAIAKNPFFNKIVVIPCGQRGDKNYVDNHLRMRMVENAFAGIARIVLDMRNLIDDIFTSDYHLETLYQAHDVALWHAVGSDCLVRDDRVGLNLIQRRWTEGLLVWKNFGFLIIPRNGYPVEIKFLPKRCIILQDEFVGSSTDVRNAIRKGAPFKHLVDFKTYDLIVRKNLYR